MGSWDWTPYTDSYCFHKILATKLMSEMLQAKLKEVMAITTDTKGRLWGFLFSFKE